MDKSQMSTSNRRTSERREEQAPVGLMMAAGSLEGETVNISQNGALVRANGHISILLNFEGKEYRGRLVRATPIDSETTAYAIQLDDIMDGDQPGGSQNG